MAESSLTLPSVGAVLDFGMHRVNEYNDEVRSRAMSGRCQVRQGKRGGPGDFFVLEMIRDMESPEVK